MQPIRDVILAAEGSSDPGAQLRAVASLPVPPSYRGVVVLRIIGQAAFEVHRNAHQGKVGVRCLAPTEGLGVRNPELRAQHETSINAFRGQ